MFSKLWKQPDKSKQQESSEPRQLEGEIRVIGDRSSGKTTYMAALACWPNADPDHSTVQAVSSINEDGDKLIETAKNLLEQGLELEPTPLSLKIEDVKDYKIKIVLKPEFSWHNLNVNRIAQNLSIILSCKDYSGEFFSDLIPQTKSEIVTAYLEDCLQSHGIMLLLDGLAFRKDSEYANGLDKFLRDLNLSGSLQTMRKIALVITKCEQPELWINRHQPQTLVQARFPKVFQRLKNWEQLGGGQIDVFATSAFGMIGTSRPEPNMRKVKRDRDGLKNAILRNPQKWKPFGLVAPIYWLCTGKHHKRLDQE